MLKIKWRAVAEAATTSALQVPQKTDGLAPGQNRDESESEAKPATKTNRRSIAKAVRGDLAIDSLDRTA